MSKESPRGGEKGQWLEHLPLRLRAGVWISRTSLSARLVQHFRDRDRGPPEQLDNKTSHIVIVELSSRFKRLHPQ